MVIRRRIMQGAGVAMAMLLGACAQVEVRYPDGRTQSMSKAEFKAYAETVFRRQNRVVDRLIRADVGIDNEGLASDARLLRAEETMEDACRPLIDLVSAKAEGRKMDLLDKLEMPSAVPACDRAVKDLEALLPTPPTS